MDIEAIFAPDARAVIIAATLGALIGIERELAGKDPSIRTFSLIALGSCLFSLVSFEAANGPVADPTRIAAQIVTGIGFIGAGTIFRSPRGVSGFTTAALMWLTAAIGMAVGFGRISLAVSTTAVALVYIFALRGLHRLIYRYRRKKGKPLREEITPPA